MCGQFSGHESQTRLLDEGQDNDLGVSQRFLGRQIVVELIFLDTVESTQVRAYHSARVLA